jgi:hypothetical protein
LSTRAQTGQHSQAPSIAQWTEERASFYSSQGRSGTFFDDRNSDLIDKVIGKGVQTFEMEVGEARRCVWPLSSGSPAPSPIDLCDQPPGPGEQRGKRRHEPSHPCRCGTDGVRVERAVTVQHN